MSAPFRSGIHSGHGWLLLLAFLFAGSLRADDLFLFLEGLPGESLDSRHKGWIQVTSFQEGVVRSNPPPARPAFKSLTLTKSIDKSSPRLVERCASAVAIRSGILEMLTRESTPQRYLKVMLTNITVVAFHQSSTTGNPLPIDSVSLSFRGVSWTYTVFGDDGRPLKDITCSWDATTGTGVGGTPGLDTDEDGLPDDYELLYGLNPTQPDASNDLDGDGLSNLDEFRAATRPNQRDSVLRSTGLTLDEGKVRLRWFSVPGKTYRVLAAPDITGPFEFVQFSGPVTGAETESELELQTTTGRRFFLIEAD